jgi:hypothetical protein
VRPLMLRGDGCGWFRIHDLLTLMRWRNSPKV